MQRSIRPLLFGFLALLSFALSGCNAFSLAADVTPPPGYVTPSAPLDQPVAASTVFPLLPPDPAAGKVVFDSKCEPCHGATGLGDGSKAGNLPERPPLIGGSELALRSRPADWFAIVSEGNLEKFMPGFKSSLDDHQRWDVIAYVLTLSHTPADLETGKTLYDAQCAVCHGQNGQGDGSQAAGKSIPDWSKQDRLAKLSGQEIAAVIASGRGSMPAFGTLNQDERLALAVYVRQLTFASSTRQTADSGTQTSPTSESAANPPEGPTSEPGTEATPAAQVEAANGKLVIRGKITAQGEGIETGGQAVKLVGFEGMDQVMEESTTSAADGTYEFQVENKPAMAYMVQIEYEGFSYNSDILHSQDVIESPADLPVSIYPTTTDTSAISIDRMHVFFDFSVPNTIQVVELFIISNSGPAVVVAESPEKPALAFRLPGGAADLQFESGGLGDRYVETSDGFGDLSAVGPGQGQHQVLFSYSLPYDKKLDLAIPVPMDVGAAVVMMPQGGVKMQSAQLVAAGSRDVQGITFDLFTGADLAAGSDLTMNLSGKVRAESAAAPSSLSGLLIGLGAFGLVLIGTGVWFFRLRAAQGRDELAEAEGESGESETIDSLLDAILTLDDLHQAGKLPEEAYQQRRADLKAQLKALKEG
jgi:mono/diheme cytochrome c family protein